MTSALHQSIHLPHSVAPAVHWLERAVGAVFFTLLAPVAFAIFILTALVLVLGIANLL